MPLISRIKKNGGTAAIAVGASALMLAGVATNPAWATPPSDHSQPQKVTYCHATGSDTNPFVQITSADESIFEAHGEHQDNRDIIPAFTFTNSKGQTVSYPGQNLDASGQAILANNCEIPAAKPIPVPTETQTPTPTETPTTAPTTTSPAAVVSTPAVPSGAAAGGVVQAGVGQAAGEVSMSAQTAAGAQADDAVLSTSLFGSGLLTFACLGLARLAKRRGRHA